MEKAREFQKNIYFCFIDYAKAFDCMDHNKLWKILQKMGIPDHLICLLRNLYAGQEATVRTGHGTTDWFQIGKGVRQGMRRGRRGWDGWMASLTRWTWVWVNSGSWWCTGRPGMLRFMGWQRVKHDWATEPNWRYNRYNTLYFKYKMFSLLIFWIDVTKSFSAIYNYSTYK